jgi:hypothetical protein
VDDELVPAQIALGLDLDRVRAERGKTMLMRLARGLGLFERSHPLINTA